MSCGVGHRCGLDLVLLWLQYRLVATAPIQHLVWEPPYAVGVALKKKKLGVPVVAKWLMNPARNHEVVGSIPGLTHWAKDPALP